MTGRIVNNIKLYGYSTPEYSLDATFNVDLDKIVIY